MGPLDEVFWSSPNRECPGIHELHTVVEDGNARSAAVRPPGPVNQKVKGSFSYYIDGNCERVDATLQFHLPCKVHMLLAKLHHGIILLEQISIADRLVAEFIHRVPFKSGQTNLALAEYPGRIVAEQNDSRIGKVSSFIAKFEMIQAGQCVPVRGG